jgi:hypothetical protein
LNDLRPVGGEALEEGGIERDGKEGGLAAVDGLQLEL